MEQDNFTIVNIATEPRLFLAHLGERRPCVFQVGGVEALGKPAVDGPPALLAPQPGEVR